MEAIKGFLQQCQEFFAALGHTFWSYVSDPWIAAGCALLLVVVLVIFFWSRKQPSRIRAFTNGNGYVEISRAALVDIIRAKSEQVDIEKKPGVAVRTRRGKLHVDVKIRLLPSRRLTEVSEILQQHLRDALQEGLGIRKLGNINVMVTGVRVKTGKEIRKSLPLSPKSELAKNADSETAAIEVVEDDEKKASEPSRRDKRRNRAEKEKTVEPEGSEGSSESQQDSESLADHATPAETPGSTTDLSPEAETIRRENGTA